MKNNDLYRNNYQSGEYSPNDAPGEKLTSTVGVPQQTHYQSMDTIKKDRVVDVGTILLLLKKVGIALLIIIAVVGTLAKITHGKALFLDKVEGEIIDRDIIFNYSSFSRTTSYNKVTIAYTYKGKNYTVEGQCKTTKMVGEKVYVYVSMLDNSKVVYYDPLSVSFVLVPFMFGAFALLYKKLKDNCIVPPLPRSFGR